MELKRNEYEVKGYGVTYTCRAFKAEIDDNQSMY